MAKDKVDYSIYLDGIPDGLKQLQDKFKKMDPKFAFAWRKAIHHAGMFIKREAMLRTPVDTGALKNSARYRTKGQGWNSFGEVSYHTDYAVIVHELHKTKSKYLENAYRDNKAEILHRMTMLMQKAASQ